MSKSGSGDFGSEVELLSEAAALISLPVSAAQQKQWHETGQALTALTMPAWLTPDVSDAIAARSVECRGFPAGGVDLS